MTDDFTHRAHRHVEDRLGDLSEVVHASAAIAGDVAKAAAAMRDAISAGGRLYFCGNGGSAADAQHLATEYVVRYRKHRAAVAAVALTTDSSLLTAAGNDLGFEEVFARQVDALVRAGDVLVIHSTSGNSANVLRAAERARATGALVVGFTSGGGGRLAALCDVCVAVPTDRADRAQELHLFLGHVICELIENDL